MSIIVYIHELLELHLLSLLFVLADALVPLFATPNPGETDETVVAESLNITASYPEQEQWVEVSKQTGTKETSLTPNFKLNIVGSGLEAGGIGVSKHQEFSKSRLISMDSIRDVWRNLPSKVNWRVHSIQSIGSVS